ncbi:hypothetical protein GGX14DRAFT_639276 [Mycena pura]|uniref:Transmembrane protein 135 N-terminal domain-containing protein n=1 Tax=Mycena pura TaxID=153505 RepID=A0AAD6YPF1_9AGAR|nr:hypothetical protein GGX14DRAFT_639276 [Mycena pura]
MQRPPSTSVDSQNACAAPSFPSPVPQAQWLQQVASLIPKNTSHPVQVTIRTYCLALCLSLGPSLVPFLTSRSYSKKTSLKRVLARELDFRGFAFSVTLAVGGGSFIRRLWHALDSLDADTSGSGAWTAALPLKTWISLLRLRLSSVQKTFLSNVISSTAGLLLLQAGRRRSKLRASLVNKEPSASRTLDLTLLLLVRALDAGVQSFVAQRSGSRRESDAEHPGKTSQTDMQRIAASAHREALRKQIDSFLFWACSARIMWCFFYEQQRLPVSYVKWINTLAGLDSRLLETLRAIRTRQWSYRTGLSSPPDLLKAYARDLGYPAAWGDPAILPAYGGSDADEVWKQLGLTTRSGVGGVPCQVVHGRVGSNFGLEHSCTANATLRGIKAFLEAIAIYLPVQFLPVILSRPRALLDPQRVLESLFSALRSATFLSTFVATYWYSVCLTRSVIFARLFPFISHDFYDGPFGCVLAGCLVCGSSIWIENGRRRGEMALYVLPRAVRSCLPDTWVRSGNWGVLMTERLTFVLSLSSLLTAASHHAHVLRGLSRWGLRFILRGPDVVFWRDNSAFPSEKRKIHNPNPVK